MTLQRTTIPLIVVALCIWGCDGNPEDPQSTSFFAHVLDETGQPVPDVAVHYIFELLPDSLLRKRSEIAPSTTIRFVIPNAGHVFLTILRWHTREVLDTLADTIFAAGNYTIQFDSAPFSNGLYIYRLEHGDTVTERSFTLLNVDIVSLGTSRPFVRSDAFGGVEIPMDQFGFDVPILQSSVAGETVDTVFISRSVDFVLVKSGFQTLVQKVNVASNSKPGQTFILTNE